MHSKRGDALKDRDHKTAIEISMRLRHNKAQARLGDAMQRIGNALPAMMGEYKITSDVVQGMQNMMKRIR